MMTLLESLVESKGWNPKDYISKTYTTFGPSSQYHLGMTARTNLPMAYPWRQKSLTMFVENVDKGKVYPETGSEDEQIDAVVKIIPIVALLAGSHDLIQKVEDVIRITQDSDISVGFGLAGAMILESIMLGNPPLDAVKSCIQTLRNPKWSSLGVCPFVASKLEEVIRLSSTPHLDLVQKLGKS